jgi:CheY-like chemotaxis protein
VEQAPVEMPSAAATGVTGQTQRRILVVDDEELVRGTLAMILTHQGYSVDEAATPESALRQIHNAPQRFQLMVTDLAMPGMNGIRLSEKARQLLPALTIVVLSGHFTDQDRAALGQSGITCLLHKPFSRDELAKVVRLALAPSGDDTGA